MLGFHLTMKWKTPQSNHSAASIEPLQSTLVHRGRGYHTPLTDGRLVDDVDGHAMSQPPSRGTAFSHCACFYSYGCSIRLFEQSRRPSEQHYANHCTGNPGFAKSSPHCCVHQMQRLVRPVLACLAQYYLCHVSVHGTMSSHVAYEK